MNNNLLNTILGIIVVLLLLCLFHMPYGYFTFVRLATTIAFSIMAYVFYSRNSIKLSIVFGGLAVLFQPFIKIALGRGGWNFVDVAVAIFLIYVILNENKSTK